MASIGEQDYLKVWHDLPNLESAGPFLHSQEEKLQKITRDLNVFSHRYEKIPYHTEFQITTAEFLWKQISTIPKWIQVFLVIIPLVFLIADIFLNLIAFFLGNPLYALYNVFIADPLNEKEQKQYADLCKQKKGTELIIKKWNEKIQNDQKNRKTMEKNSYELPKTKEELEKLQKMNADQLQKSYEKQREYERQISVYEQNKSILEDNLKKAQKTHFMSYLPIIGNWIYTNAERISLLVKNLPEDIAKINQELQNFKTKHHQEMCIISDGIMLLEKIDFDITSLLTKLDHN
jgi:tRNA isopentenyl-2-thiomethyl-A-37 hydroxylase MiaE